MRVYIVQWVRDADVVLGVFARYYKHWNCCAKELHVCMKIDRQVSSNTVSHTLR